MTRLDNIKRREKALDEIKRRGYIKDSDYFDFGFERSEIEDVMKRGEKADLMLKMAIIEILDKTDEPSTCSAIVSNLISFIESVREVHGEELFDSVLIGLAYAFERIDVNAVFKYDKKGGGR